MQNNFHLINNEKQLNYSLCSNQNLDLLTLDLKQDLIIDINLNQNNQSNINFTCLNNDQIKHKIIINVYIEFDNIDCNLIANILSLNEANTTIEINAYSKNKVSAKINLEINGIIDGKTSCISAIPKFIFHHNNLNAKHGVMIGSVNWKELVYLETRGIDEHQAKSMLISSKLFTCLKHLNEQEQNKYQQAILKKWKDTENA